MLKVKLLFQRRFTNGLESFGRGVGVNHQYYGA